MSMFLASLGALAILLTVLALMERNWFGVSFWCGIGLLSMAALEVVT